MLIEFWIPKDTSLDALKILYENTLKNSSISGVIMACSHKDNRGQSLKQSVDYLGELYQVQIMK